MWQPAQLPASASTRPRSSVAAWAAVGRGELLLGGAANAAHNVHDLGARVMPIGVLGRDAAVLDGGRLGYRRGRGQRVVDLIGVVKGSGKGPGNATAALALLSVLHLLGVHDYVIHREGQSLPRAIVAARKRGVHPSQILMWNCGTARDLKEIEALQKIDWNAKLRDMFDAIRAGHEQ